MRSADRPVQKQRVPRDTSQRSDEEVATAAFGSAVAAFQAGLDDQGSLRAEFTFEDVPAPKRLAPFAAATAATVRRDDADIAWGRLVLLYDPAAPEGWHGCYRLISYLRAEIDPEIAADPMLGQVGWTWLMEALDARTPGYNAPSGTVTRVSTEGFGGKEEEPPIHGYEQRASWSPAAAGPGQYPGQYPGRDAGKGQGPGQETGTGLDGAGPDGLDLGAHVTAWCDSLAAAAGLPPLAPGTYALPSPGRGTEQWPRRRQ